MSGLDQDLEDMHSLGPILSSMIALLASEHLISVIKSS